MSSREKGSAISRVMQIIDAVATAERPLSPADLACQLAIPKPSIHRLLNPVSYTHLPSPRDLSTSRMPSSA